MTGFHDSESSRPNDTATAHSMSIVDVRCDAIQVGERHRKDLGELEVLAASIATEGLLQPIGITEANVLVFGERRLRAFQDVLRRETIPARVVHVGSIAAGEYAENELRKDFTPSERVEIGKAIQREIGNRQGERTDVELPDNCPEVAPGIETREVAAKKAGFDSYKTYERARTEADAQLELGLNSAGFEMPGMIAIPLNPASPLNGDCEWVPVMQATIADLDAHIHMLDLQIESDRRKRRHISILRQRVAAVVGENSDMTVAQAAAMARELQTV